MKLRIMSKRDAENFKEEGYHCISLISLIETEMINPIFEETLSIRVDDITDKIQKDMIESGFKEYEQYILFNDSMKAKIIDFIDTHRPKKLVVHCSMGVSRSSAVSCLVLSHCQLCYDKIIESSKYMPNKYILDFVDHKSKTLLDYVRGDSNDA